MITTWRTPPRAVNSLVGGIIMRPHACMHARLTNESVRSLLEFSYWACATAVSALELSLSPAHSHAHTHTHTHPRRPCFFSHPFATQFLLLPSYDFTARAHLRFFAFRFDIKPSQQRKPSEREKVRDGWKHFGSPSASAVT
jgi:hypothetical protein